MALPWKPQIAHLGYVAQATGLFVLLFRSAKSYLGRLSDLWHKLKMHELCDPKVVALKTLFSDSQIAQSKFLYLLNSRYNVEGQPKPVVLIRASCVSDASLCQLAKPSLNAAIREYLYQATVARKRVTNA